MRAILTFHSVDPTDSVLSIAPGQLRSLIAAIESSGHRIVPLRDILDSPAKPRQIALTFPDYVGEYSSMNEFADIETLSRDGVLWARDQYLRDPADRKDWRASPLLAASLKGVAPARADAGPPALGERDELHRISSRARFVLRMAGGRVPRVAIGGSVHFCGTWALSATRRAN